MTNCGGCSRNKINRNKNGNRVKKNQKCSSCNFKFLSSTIHNCCPKCDKEMSKKNNDISE